MGIDRFFIVSMKDLSKLFMSWGIEYLIHCLALSVFVLGGGFRKYDE